MSELREKVSNSILNMLPEITQDKEGELVMPVTVLDETVDQILTAIREKVPKKKEEEIIYEGEDFIQTGMRKEDYGYNQCRAEMLRRLEK